MSILNGLAIGEMFAGGIAASQNNARHRRVVSEAQEIIDQVAASRDKYVAELENSQNINASNFAEKHALRVALAKFDPNHPLVANKHLQEKIHEAGARVWVLSKDRESVAKVGREFKY